MKEEIVTSSNKLKLKNIKISDMGKIEDFLYFVLDNGQKFLTDGENYFDISEFNSISNIFLMGERIIAVVSKWGDYSAVDLKTKEVIFEDRNAYYINKLDDKRLDVIMKINGGPSRVYDIEKKEYLKSPEGYKFERALGNNLYVYKKEDKTCSLIYDYDYHVVDEDGKILLKKIKDTIYLKDNKVILLSDEKIGIIDLDEDNQNIKTVEKNERIISNPDYYDEMIVIIEKGAVKLYTPALELVREFKVKNIDEVIQHQIVGDTLKLLLPFTDESGQVNRHLFLNLKSGKTIEHLRIEGYPHFNPSTFIGRDTLENKDVEFHIYDNDFNVIRNVTADSYECVDYLNECIFVLDGNGKSQLLNTSNNTIKEVNYDNIYFHLTLPYGHGINKDTGMMDFFDEDFNVVIPNVDYKKYDLDCFDNGFKYFIMNNYICIIKEIYIPYGGSRYRTIVQSADGEVILDSLQHQCYAMGNFMQIMEYDDTQFLNTFTGEIGHLGIMAETDEIGKIKIEELADIDKHLIIEKNNEVCAIESIENDIYKTKKRGKKAK